MGDLLDCATDPAMLRLAREYGRRASLTLRGISRAQGLTAIVPVAIYFDGGGMEYRRTLDDLRRCLAEKPAPPRERRAAVDARTLPLF